MVEGADERVKDGSWDYYGGAIYGGGGGALVIQKRNDAFHTAYHGDLAGRALEQVEAVKAIADANTVARWPGKASITPVELTHNIGAFTMRATLDRVSGTYPAGAHMRIEVAGRNGALVPAVENDFNTPATLAFTLAQANALLVQARNHVVRVGLRIYDDDQASNHIATLPLDFPIVQPNTLLGWRVLTGASPYTIRPTDSEFEVWITEGSGLQEQFGKRISRLMLSTVDRRFPVLTNTPKDITNRAGVTLRLNAAGTQLIASIYKVGGNNAGTWVLTQINAR